MMNHELSKKIDNAPYLIVVPDGTGSKGDEAMIAGCLNLLHGMKAFLITPNQKLWSDVLIGYTHLFDEAFVPTEQLPTLFDKPRKLIVIGADTMDGSCGYEEAYWRCEAVKAAVEHGGEAVVFCSIRSDMEERLVQEWKTVSPKVKVFLRDTVSEKNFLHQTGRTGGYFPDLSFFTSSNQTERAHSFYSKLQEKFSGKRIIGLNISEAMFRSFYTEITDENRVEFARNIAMLAVQGVSAKDSAVLLLCHDTRSWDAQWSDYQFACAAQEYLKSTIGIDCIAQPPELTQAELRTIVSLCDVVICGRMHMSVTSCLSGVVPIVVAGKGKNYTMTDKVRGMCREWLGTDENMIENLHQIPLKRDLALQDGKWRKSLKQKLEQLPQISDSADTKFEKILGVKSVEWNPQIAHEVALMRAMQRSAELAQKAVEQKTTISNKEGHIQILLQSERDLQGQVQTLNAQRSDFENKIKELNIELRDKQQHIELLLQSEQDLQGQVQMLTAQRSDFENKIKELNVELCNKQGHIELLLQSDRELERIHNSRSWKFMGFFWKVRDVLLPKSSRRRLLLKLFAKFLRHPIHFIGKINKQRVKRLVDGMQTGQIQDTAERMNRCFDSGDVRVESIQLIDAPQVESTNAAEYEHFSVATSLHPKVSIIVPVYNQFHYTYACLKSIAVNSGEIPYEVLIANDCSTDLTTQLEEIIGGVKVITNEENLRFLRNCNHAAKEAKGEYILFLNNDTQVQSNWLQPLIDLIESDETIGMVGSKLIYPNGLLQEAGGIIWKDASAWNYGNGQNPAMPEYSYVKEVDYISGAAIMIRTSLWNQLGGFDETFAPAYCEDSDLAFQVRAAGYKVMLQPKSVVVHFEGVSNGTNTSSGQKAYQVLNQKKFYEKWKDVLEKENNPNGVDSFRARDRSLHKKTLLMIDHYVPQFDKDAGSRSMFQYLKLFVSQGYNVKFLGDNFYQHEPYTTILQQMGIEVLYGVWYRDHWQEWIKQNADDFDYIFLSRPHITVKYVDFVREKTHAKLVYYGHDLHFLREQKKYESTGDPKALEESLKFKKMESSIFEKVDTVYYLNKEELETVKEIAPSANVRRSVINIFEDIPDVDYVPEKRRDILFVGGFGHDPNVDAIIWAAREIMPKIWEYDPDIKLRVVGSNATKEVLDLASDRIILEGFVSDEKLKEIYASCKVVLVPLRYGGGIKGKVVEAMRYGIPLITTETGAEGLDGIEKFIPIAEKETQDMAKKTLDLYHNDVALISISKQEVEYIRKNMSVEHALGILSKDFDFSKK